MALEPDLVLTFSDLQAEIVATLVKRGVAVHAFNHRTVAGILAMIETLGALIGAPEKGAHLAAGLKARVEARSPRGSNGAHRPKILFP